MKKLYAALFGIMLAAGVSLCSHAEGCTISHESGTYNSIQFVTLSADENAVIYYTTDGSMPDENSAVYETAPIVVTENTTIKTAVCENGSLTQSACASIKIRSVAPSASVKSGTYSAPVTLTLTAKEKGAVIYYTTDGSVPSKKSAKYTKPLTISADSVIRYCAYAPNKSRSAIGKRSFTFTDSVYPEKQRQEMFELVNKTRAEYGLAPLSELPVLSEIALQRAKECSSYFSHWRANGTKWDALLAEAGLKRSARAENICYYYPTAQQALACWMNDYAHRANILNPDVKYIGIGWYNNGYTDYWTQIFIGE